MIDKWCRCVPLTFYREGQGGKPEYGPDNAFHHLTLGCHRLKVCMFSLSCRQTEECMCFFGGSLSDVMVVEDSSLTKKVEINHLLPPHVCCVPVCATFVCDQSNPSNCACSTQSTTTSCVFPARLCSGIGQAKRLLWATT